MTSGMPVTARPFIQTHLTKLEHTIVWKEPCMIVLAVAVFGPEFDNSKLLMYTNSQTVQQCKNAGSCKGLHVIALIILLRYQV